MSDVDTTRDAITNELMMFAHKYHSHEDYRNPSAASYHVKQLENLLSQTRDQAFDDLLEAMPNIEPKSLIENPKDYIAVGGRVAIDEVRATIHQLKSSKKVGS